MKTIIRYCLFLFLLIFTNCDKRDWDNPFDPGCPKEIFTPTNFTAEQEGEQIKLSWNQPNVNISGFEIERKVGTGNYTSIASPGKGTTTASSNVSLGGELYTFKLVAQAGSNKSNEVTTTITPVLKASVTTSEITNITDSTATSGGTIPDDGGSTVTARGVVWNTSPNPTVEDNMGKTNNGTGTGNFTSELTNLDEGTSYYVRSYATNSKGIEYGNELTFTTHEKELPSVNTFVPQNIIPGAATLGGEVTAAGASEIIERGVCWATNPTPTIEDNRAVFQLFGSDGIESYSREITGFLANTTYYVRAYAKNSNGTAYGQEESWTTSPEIALPTVTTNEPEDITTSSAVLGGHVDNTGGTFVSEWGVVYGISPNPTIEDNKFVIQDTQINGNSGSIGVTVNELNAGTNYYLRAYAINSQGTGYGEQKSFTTESSMEGTVTDIDGNVYQTVTIGDQVWMAENLKTTKYNDGTIVPLIEEQGEIGGTSGWRNLSYGAYCWYNNDESIYDIKNTPLYNWYAVETGKLCPAGWHVPSDTDWNKLSNFLGGKDVAGGKMKMITGWSDPNADATNSSGFSALPGGTRDGRGVFIDMRSFAGWWSSTEESSTLSWGWSVSASYEKIIRWYHDKVDGRSVRCIKDQ